MTIFQKKICLLGDFAVGKTSLVRRFVDERFDDRYLSTIGVKISRRSLRLAELDFNFLIWDLAGGDDYVNAQAGYLRGAAGALIVCDLTRSETLSVFHRYTEQMLAVNSGASFVFLANKVDLIDKRQISDIDLQTIRAEYHVPVLLTSAKTGENVSKAFAFLAEQIVRNSKK
jgi:small GTP-binding protein